MAKKLRKEVAEKYDLVGIEPSKIVHEKFGTLDFTAMGIEEADLLYKGGIPFLKRKYKTDKQKPEDKGL